MPNLHIILHIILGQHACIVRTWLMVSLGSVVKTNSQTKHSMTNYYGWIDKTDLIIIGAKHQRNKVVDYFPVQLLDNDTSPADTVGNLGVVFDNDFCVHQCISQVCKFLLY